MFILLVCWIAAGLIAGFAGSKIVNSGDDDPRLGLMAGVAGAVVGGGVFHFFAKTPPNLTDWWSVPVAAAVAAAAVLLWHVARKYTSRA